MNDYKEATIQQDDEDQIVDICDQCSQAVYSGQQVWKVGSEIYCSGSCLESGLQITTYKA
ncbi:hypothetical protein BP422_12145 [Brevibacillus formosus]|uniref:Uncharacterized protein n=1 Tax=Brevibacillus formosus TaxID=54913 RepID=A0A220MH10_9BACL|nr:hypothetical protein [Brevibacillus formosus]ASJ54232.1 hypothetical protein BP422_12145 [Brevibacillus formosus]